MTSPSKARKYDRQLRLWGDHGQQALERSRICVINANAVGAEILKNLVLPGIGWFTLIDDAKVTKEDLGSNFFVHPSNVGQSRAACVAEYLKEMNSDVKGEYIEDNLETILSTNPSFFNSFNIVIATQLSQKSLLLLAGLLYPSGIPLLVVRVSGMVAWMRLAVLEHSVIEAHPDDALPDLRLLSPFPSLASLCASIDMDAMDLKDHSHTPYLIVLYKQLESWRASHEGIPPRNYKEKDAFRAMIRSAMRKSEADVQEDELNFEEAIKNVNNAIVPVTIPDNIEAIFSDAKCAHLSPESNNFWIMCHALKEFAASHGSLPVRGSLPDMTADSARYVALQRVYMEKAKEDATSIAAGVQERLVAIGRPPDAILEHDLKLFCKNSAFLQLIRTPSLESELSPSDLSFPDLESQLENPDSDAWWYVLFRASEVFFSKKGCYPGTFDGQVEEDMVELKACVLSVLADMKLPSSIKEELIQEMCRYGGSELHNTAAFLGGVAAHEAIKLITHQYVPFNNTFIYNGATGTTQTFKI